MTTAQLRLTPKVSIEERDMSYFGSGESVNTGVIVGAFKRGPLNAFLATSGDDIVEKFEVSTNWGFAGHSALAFFEEADRCYIKRVVKGARHAGGVIMNAAASMFNNTNTSYFMPFMYGPYKGWEDALRQTMYVEASASLVASNSTTITLNDGTTNFNATVVFNTDHATTLRLISEAVTQLINTGVAATYSYGSSSIIGANSFGVVAPESKTFTLTLVTTGGASQPVWTIKGNAAAQTKLMEVYAENPGAWGNDVGIRIYDIKNSTYQQVLYTFSADFVTGNTVTMAAVYKGQTTNISTTFATDSATTLAAFANAIQSVIGMSGTVLVNSTARTIKVLSPNSGVNDFTSTSPITTGGASQPTATAIVETAAVENDDTFRLEVYTRANVVRPIETFYASFKKIQDGFGNSLFVEDVINSGAAGRKSNHIRINHYEGNSLGQLATTFPPNTIYWLSGGTDGTQPTSSDIANGWDEFKDRIVYPSLKILINAGYADATVHAKMIEVAETRQTTFAILDMPTASQASVQDEVSYRVNTLNANTSHAIIVTNDVKINDPFTSRPIFMPPSGKAAACAARSLKIAPWLSPAGLTRGRINGIIGVRNLYNEGQLNQLAAAQINPITNFNGYSLWDGLTLQRKASVLSYLSSRTLLAYVQEAFEKELPIFLQEPITDQLFYRIEQFGKTILDPIADNGGFNTRTDASRGYRLQCDKINNKDADKENGVVNITLFLDLVRPARSIQLVLVPIKSGGLMVQTII